ncbi:helix-turn-helix domain-containing protein [Carnobacterium pleistocenium]|uniref:helix-turn-helix domain-containing protein n=1 Tax=Carnobacterium pleistocenium TaxID=181073 RepID=UPI00068B09A1|nr:helix-turn-helix transcriptional regulator [Carnobacterium pleistocenium]
MYFRENLKRIRKEKKINQRELAELTGLSFSMISKLESGEQSNPTLETINKIADGLKVDPGELVYKLAIEVKKYEQFDHYFNSDVGLLMKFIVSQLKSDNHTLLFDGEALDDEKKELLRSSLNVTYEMVKLINKKKKGS